MDASDPVVEYTAIESQLKTGDIFTFSGDDPLDFMIELIEGGKPYSHVGMVLRFPDKDTGELFFWDAPGDGKTFPGPFISLLTPDAGPGCRVAKIRDVMSFYMSVFPKQQFSWRSLESGVKKDQYDKLTAFIQKVNGTGFPSANIPNIPKLVNLALGMLKSYTKGTLGVLVEGSYYCAQLIADTYIHMGLIDTTGGRNAGIPNAYVPADFDSTDPEQLPLTAGTCLGNVVQVHYDAVIDLGPPPGSGR
jgi:hypothetical protein